MRKLKLLVLFFMVVVLVSCSSGNSSEYTVEDFYVYDDNGEVINYPENEEFEFYDMNDKAGASWGSLSAKEGEDYTKYFTKRGVNVSSPAKVKLKEYDLTNFYFGYGDPFLLNPTIKDSTRLEKIDKYIEKYPSKNEQVLHTNELGDDIYIYISSTFYVDGEGKIQQFELDDRGNIVVDRDENGVATMYHPDIQLYKLTFYVREDNIYRWNVEHESVE